MEWEKNKMKLNIGDDEKMKLNLGPDDGGDDESDGFIKEGNEDHLDVRVPLPLPLAATADK